MLFSLSPRKEDPIDTINTEIQTPSVTTPIHNTFTAAGNSSFNLRDKSCSESRTKSNKKSSWLSMFSCSPSKKENSSIQLLGSQKLAHKGMKTLILDLDETLVHSSFSPVPNPDHKIMITFARTSVPVYVIVRPGTQEFLDKMNKLFEIVIFTASRSEYALPIIELIDKNKVVSKCLFREHCEFRNDTFVKDLSKLGRNLKDVIIVDNSPAAFILQPENAIHIKNFYFDKTDRELEELIPFLEYIANAEDVRPVPEKKIKFDLTFSQRNTLEKIVEPQSINSPVVTAADHYENIEYCSSDNEENYETADSEPITPPPKLAANLSQMKLTKAEKNITDFKNSTGPLHRNLLYHHKRSYSEKGDYLIIPQLNSALKSNIFNDGALDVSADYFEVESDEFNNEMESSGKQPGRVNYLLEYDHSKSNKSTRILFRREEIIESPI